MSRATALRGRLGATAANVSRVTSNEAEHPVKRPSATSLVLTALPAALAIGIFGLLYGAAARPLIGPEATVALSLVVFSGALQFATVGLIAAGAGPAALLLTALTLNLRHLVMGAVLRTRIRAPVLRRALLAAVLLDETFGFAVAGSTDPRVTVDERAHLAERTLAVSGVVCYAAWIGGTLLGVLGAGLPGVERIAAAVFPVLFIGLAALTTRTRSVAVRTVAAAGVTAVICVALPDVRALAPVVAGVAVALPPDRTTTAGSARPEQPGAPPGDRPGD